jgi:hypothetical protein
MSQAFYDDDNGRHYIDNTPRYTTVTYRERRVSRPRPRPLTAEERLELTIRAQEDLDAREHR